MFIIQTSHLVYLLDYLNDIVEKNTHYRYKIMILQTVSKVRLFLGSRFYNNLYN